MDAYKPRRPGTTYEDSMTLETVDADGTEYDVVSYDSSVPPVEVTTSQPAGAKNM